MKSSIRLCTLALALALAGCATAPLAPVTNPTSTKPAPAAPVAGKPNALLEDDATRAQMESFINMMAARHGFDAGELRQTFASVDHLLPPSGQHAHAPANWSEYRALFITPDVIGRGAAFMRQNHDALARAEATYQVPHEIVAAIIGVETHYGENMGRNRVLDTLSWKAFRANRRQRFYSSELENFLLLCRENKWDAHSVFGSSAGAIGLGQFEPSSYRRIAVDFDGDGKRDLYSDPADAIGSIAHYFRLSHWRMGELVAMPAAKDDAGALALDGDNGSEYWLTYRNFNAIKTYNRDNWYAMAVYQLSQELKRTEAGAGVATKPGAPAETPAQAPAPGADSAPAGAAAGPTP